MHRARHRAGFTIIEVMIVVAVIGVLAAMAVPSWRATTANNQLRDAAGDVSDAIIRARARAVASGRNYVVYFNTGLNGGTDVCGNDLVDLNGNPVPILVLDDGPPNAANCCIDPGEPIETLMAAPGVQWGIDFAAVPAPGDTDPGGTFGTGSTFRDPTGAPTEWVVFGPDGIPVGFADTGAACNPGQVGTGAGAIYVNNDLRDIGIVVTPLGSVKVHAFEKAGAAWTN